MANKQIFVHNGSLHYLEDFQLFWRRGKRCWKIDRSGRRTIAVFFCIVHVTDAVTFRTKLSRDRIPCDQLHPGTFEQTFERQVPALEANWPKQGKTLTCSLESGSLTSRWQILFSHRSRGAHRFSEHGKWRRPTSTKASRRKGWSTGKLFEVAFENHVLVQPVTSTGQVVLQLRIWSCYSCRRPRHTKIEHYPFVLKCCTNADCLSSSFHILLVFSFFVNSSTYQLFLFAIAHSSILNSRIASMKRKKNIPAPRQADLLHRYSRR